MVWRSKIRIVEPPLIAELDETAVGFGDPVAKRRARDRPEPVFEAAIVEVGRDRQLPVAVGDERTAAGDGVAKRIHERLDRLDRAPDVERVGPFERPGESPHERRGDVADVLQVLPAAVADPVRPAQSATALIALVGSLVIPKSRPTP